MMMTLRRTAAVVAGAYAAMWPPAIFVRLVDVPLGLGIALLVLGALLGGYCGYRSAKSFKPYASREHRDAVVGWSIVLIPVGVIASFLLPVPWAFAAAAGWVIAVLLVARGLLVTAPADGAPSLRTSRS